MLLNNIIVFVFQLQYQHTCAITSPNKHDSHSSIKQWFMFFISECIPSSFTIVISSDKTFVSKCDFIGLYLNITLDECFLKACIDMGTVVNFRSNVCSVTKCVGQDLKLQGDDPGWDIYKFSGLKVNYIFSASG